MVVVGWIPGVHTPAQKLPLLSFTSFPVTCQQRFPITVICHFVIID